MKKPYGRKDLLQDIFEYMTTQASLANRHCCRTSSSVFIAANAYTVEVQAMCSQPSNVEGVVLRVSSPGAVVAQTSIAFDDVLEKGESVNPGSPRNHGLFIWQGGADDDWYAVRPRSMVPLHAAIAAFAEYWAKRSLWQRTEKKKRTLAPSADDGFPPGLEKDLLRRRQLTARMQLK